MIVALTDVELNISGNQVYTICPEEMKALNSMGVISKKSRNYALTLNYRDYQLLCPLFDMGDGRLALIWPSFKLPRRPYPCFVYIYAVALYLSTGRSMRDVASEVRKRFGLTTFSHSTISRALKKLLQQIDLLKELMWDPAKDSQTEETVWRKSWDDVLKRKTDILLTVLHPSLSHPVFFGSKLAYAFYTATCRFLL